MPIYKPAELHAFLDSLGISPQRRLSQNFLIDGNVIRKIIAAAEVSPGDVVLEIGPGPGGLTEVILDAGAHVCAVEKDRVLAEALKRLDGPLDVFCEDILQFPIEKELAPLLAGGKKAKVIANLPYHLTTPILAHLMSLGHLFSSIVVMVQEEVARRFVALPSTPEYSSFTLHLNFYSKPSYAFTVSNNCFYPKPKVDSAVVKFELRAPPEVSDRQAFFLMTRTAFAQRRKMLRRSLKELCGSERVEKGLKGLSLNAQSRPEELSLEQFLGLFEALSSDKTHFMG